MQQNPISHEDFELFYHEKIQVDFIALNTNKLFPDDIQELADSFQSLGFNSFSKKDEANKSRMVIGKHDPNNFEVVFILKVNYQPQLSQIQFTGLNGKKFYQLVKQQRILWDKLTKFQSTFSRIDLVYRRKNKSTDKYSYQEFINSSFIEFQELHPRTNLKAEKNSQGLLLKIGHRKSQRHYRIYFEEGGPYLRFEAEMKGDLIKDFNDLFITSKFNPYDFESRLSYQFFKYSFRLFRDSMTTSHLDWLYDRIRPLQVKDMILTNLPIPIMHSHYLNQMDFNRLEEKQHLITLLQLLMFTKRLKCRTGKLNSKFLEFRFPLRDFLIYTGRSSNQTQLNKLIDFFDLVQKNFVIQSFSDSYYRILVTIPEVSVKKTRRNHWEVTIWIAEDLFDYLHPFLLTDLFQVKLTADQFQVLFEVIKIYSSLDRRKEFDIQTFLDNYPSKRSGKQKRLIKEYFIEQLQILNREGRIQDRVLDLNSNQVFNINQLNISHLKIGVFETIDPLF